MIIHVNGKEVEVNDGTTILTLLEARGMNPAAVVVEHNYVVPEREQWGGIILNEKDNIEIVKFMGGG